MLWIIVAVFVVIPQDTNQNVQETPTSGDHPSDDISLLTGETINSGDSITGTDNPLIYTNTEFWFQLTLPEWWEDYKAFVYSWINRFPKSIVITLPTTMSWYKGVINPNDANNFLPSNTGSYTYIKGYAVMLDMIMLDNNTYEVENKRCKENQEPWCLGDILWHNNLYYYIVVWPQELTTDLDKKWWDRTYFDKIYKTFKIL